jgi:3',5'-cyclic AMP phosphodiesterase CpdA
METSPTRRETLKTFLTISGGTALAGFTLGTSMRHAADPGPKRGVLRIAHLTDVHVEPGDRAARGLAACLRHVQALADPPDVIFNGGDAIQDGFAASRASTRAQWDVWRKVLRDECGFPMEHCLGNHDLWGGDRKKGSAPAADPLQGKQWALDVYGLSERFRSFDRAGWHFIVLDSTFAHGEGYEARLDDTQFEWLAADLGKVSAGTPVLVLSHIPILCACGFFDGTNERNGSWVVPGSWMHLDARRLKDLFHRHPNVRLCLSGHIHLRDRVDYNGVTYLCNGAVCGAWWRGAYQECRPGYGLIDLYDDGTFDHQYLTYD